MDPSHLIELHHEGSIGPFRNLEPCRLYRIVHIHRIYFDQIAWFRFHIREDPSDILSDVYFPADDMFTTNSEFSINHLNCSNALRWGMCSDYRTYDVGYKYNSLQGQAIVYPVLYHSSTLARLYRLQLDPR